jgi:hypothetical protein
MRTSRTLEQVSLALIISLFSICVHSQGAFVYDQQSSDESNISGLISIQPFQPMGQSFTPTLPSVEFVRLALQDINFGNALGATLYVNLRSGSITGAVLAASSPVFMPDSFFGVTNFFFSPGASLTPGTTYYLQPVVQSGDVWGVAAYNGYNYTGGTEFLQGAPFGNNDLWFREGVVPEPSSLSLVLLGVGAFVYRRRSTRKLLH